MTEFLARLGILPRDLIAASVGALVIAGLWMWLG